MAAAKQQPRVLSNSSSALLGKTIHTLLLFWHQPTFAKNFGIKWSAKKFLRYVMPHCVDIWNCRYFDFYQGPMTVYLHLYSTNFVSQFLLWSSIRTCLQSSHYEDNHYIFLCCECQSLSMPNKACPKVQSFLVFGLFFYWFLNYTRGRAFRREISNIHTVRELIHL